LNQIENIVKTP